MKSPLVEALKQASGEEAAADKVDAVSTELEVEAKPDAANDQALDPGALELMQTMDVLPIDGMHEKAPDDEAEDDRDLPESAPEIAPEPGAVVVAPAFAVRHGRVSGLARTARYTPVLCLLLVGFGALSQYSYQSMGGALSGSGLDSMSSRQAEPTATRTPEPGTTPQNRFELISNLPQARRDDPALAPASRAAPAVTVPTTRAVETAIAPLQEQGEDKAFAVLNAAYDAYQAGDVTAAERGYRDALVIAPRHPNALQGLAGILYQSGRYEEALQLYESLLSVEPDNTAAAVALLAGHGDNASDASESEIKYLIQGHPDSAHLQFALGTVMARQSRWPDARHAFAKALRLDAGNADYLFNLAVSLEHLGRIDDARRHYRLALDAATASSSLDSDVVIARIGRLGDRVQGDAVQ